MATFKRSYDTVWKKIGDMKETELKKLCAWGFYQATGIEPKINDCILLESDEYSVWFRVGAVHFYIESYEADNGFMKHMFISDSHKCLNELVV